MLNSVLIGSSKVTPDLPTDLIDNIVHPDVRKSKLYALPTDLLDRIVNPDVRK